MDANENIIELIDVRKEFEDDTIAVDNFNLQVKKGEFVTFLGPSGCGKTTTLRMIAGFELPSSGQILLNGQDISKLPPQQAPCKYRIPEICALPPPQRLRKYRLRTEA